MPLRMRRRKIRAAGAERMGCRAIAGGISPSLSALVRFVIEVLEARVEDLCDAAQLGAARLL
jgi:hypothetical protein